MATTSDGTVRWRVISRSELRPPPVARAGGYSVVPAPRHALYPAGPSSGRIHAAACATSVGRPRPQRRVRRQPRVVVVPRQHSARTALDRYTTCRLAHPDSSGWLIPARLAYRLGRMGCDCWPCAVAAGSRLRRLLPRMARPLRTTRHTRRLRAPGLLVVARRPGRNRRRRHDQEPLRPPRILQMVTDSQAQRSGRTPRCPRPPRWPSHPRQADHLRSRVRPPSDRAGRPGRRHTHPSPPALRVTSTPTQHDTPTAPGDASWSPTRGRANPAHGGAISFRHCLRSREPATRRQNRPGCCATWHTRTAISRR